LLLNNYWIIFAMNSPTQNTSASAYQAPLMDTFSLAGLKVLPQLNRLEGPQATKQTAIEPRLMNLLCFLAANQGCVVDRDTLVERLWPEVIVNENSLTRAVSELRKHLRSATNGSNVRIETIPKKGYRLVAPNQDQRSNTTARLFGPIRQGGIEHWIRRSPKAFAGAAFAASLGFFALLPPLADLKQAPVAGFSDELVALQPSYLGGKVELSASDLALATPATTRPVISHDGTSFAYLKYDGTGSTVFFGSLSESVDPQPIYHSADKVLNLAWSPTGDRLLFANQPAMTTAALFSGQGGDLELLALNPHTREIQRLVATEVEAGSSVAADQNLT
jgi:DNA-binding winged helix-turn-helix (wHTH) protein